jgi:hypothetical protein
MTLQWATFIMATVAAVGSLVRIYQNERLYRWHLKRHRKKKRK